MKTPRLKRHVSGRAYTRFKGKCTYFGKFGTEAAQQRFQQWLADMDLVEDKFRHVSLLLLAAKFMDHADVHYRKNGVPTGEANNIRLAMRTACTMYGNSRVSEFGPKRLKAVRNQMIQDGLCRNTVNARIRRIRHVFKWGVSEQLVPVSVLIGLQTVQGLEAGRTSARETDPVEPVAELDILALEPYVSRPVWGLIQFMLLTGARPGEAVRLRWCDIDAESDVWVYRPNQHKTEHHGKSRRILIGPRAQVMITQFAGSDQNYVFRPADAPGSGGNVGDHYSRESYRTAVIRACEKAFGCPAELRIDNGRKPYAGESADELQERRDRAKAWRAKNCWSPNQLRHNNGTEVRKLGGIETAQVILGHTSVKTTERYAETNIDGAIAHVRQFG